ncbi:MAG: nitroreductase family protein [Bacteroidales bacterium]|nr:nitroreductase family protein [Bacteroidales bacterium]
MSTFCTAQETIKLNAPTKTGGMPIMEAFSKRASASSFDSKELSIQDLSDLLWSANGINRTDGKKTAPSAMNVQDIDIYVFLSSGIYLFDAKENILKQVVKGDQRSVFSRANEQPPALLLLLVSDNSKFGNNIDDSTRFTWGNIDAGIVSQNVAMFCAAKGFKTRPRALMPTGLDKLIGLKAYQKIVLNMPVSY